MDTKTYLLQQRRGDGWARIHGYSNKRYALNRLDDFADATPRSTFRVVVPGASLYDSPREVVAMRLAVTCQCGTYNHDGNVRCCPRHCGEHL